MRRDTRRFIVHRFRLLEAPVRRDVNLNRVWKQRFGYTLPYNGQSIAGFHFSIPDGKGLLLVKPDRLAVSALLLKQACTLIEARHGAPARLAEPDEVPSARQREARGMPVGEEVVEQWPPDEHQAETVVAEYITAPTFFLRADATLGSGWWTAATDSVPDARSFESAAEANEWLQHHGVGNHFALRYQAAARAEADQRETAAYDQDVTT